VWKTGLPVHLAILKPHIERGQFLKSLPPLKKRPNDFSVGAGDVGEDFIAPHHHSGKWFTSGDEDSRVVRKDTFIKQNDARSLIRLLLNRPRALLLCSR
jgi:hypothetical protein